MGMTARRSVGTTKSSSWLAPAASEGIGKVARLEADRDLDVQRAQPRPGAVGGDEAAGRGRPDADPRRVKLDGDVEARPPGDEAHRDEQRDQAAGRDEEQLLPAEPDTEQPGRHHDDDGGAARGRRHLPHPARDGTRRPQRGGEAVRQRGRRAARPARLAEIPDDDPERTRAPPPSSTRRDLSAGGPGTAAGRSHPPR